MYIAAGDCASMNNTHDDVGARVCRSAAGRPRREAIFRPVADEDGGDGGGDAVFGELGWSRRPVCSHERLDRRDRCRRESGA